MEIYGLDRGFKRQVPVDDFISAIWTERYYGDDDFEIIVPPTQFYSDKLTPGVLMEETSSDIPMIIEDSIIEDGLLKVTGNSLTEWFNNRIIRASAYPTDDSWVPDVAMSPGLLIATIINYWVTGVGSPYLVDPPLGPGNALTSDPGTIMGMAHPSRLKIPHMTVGGYDNTLAAINDISIPYGPVYDAIKDIATAYALGIKTQLETVEETYYDLKFYVYLGKNRTSDQTVNPVVKFSPLDNSLTNIKKLDSIADSKTLFLGYGTNVSDDAATYYVTPSYLDVPANSGLDLRAQMINYEDITQEMLDPYGGPIDQGLAYGNMLTLKLYQEWRRRGGVVSLVDGDIGNSDRYIYGEHYGLGDVIELEAFEGFVSKAMVTEYIRSQDAAGEKRYPTVALVE